MAKLQDPDRARRFARTIASDLSLYHGELLDEGVRRDALFELASSEFEAGRRLYAGRVDFGVDPEHHFYWQAIVDVILRSRAHVASPIW